MISSPHRNTAFRRGFPALLLLLLTAVSASAQEVEDPVSIAIEVRPGRAAPGAEVTVLLTAEIAPGYHLYGLPPVPALTYPTGVLVLGPRGYEAVGEASAPEPDFHLDETLGGDLVPWFTGTVTFEQRVRVPANAPPGAVELRLGLDFMSCTEQFCLDPETIEATATLVITADAEGEQEKREGQAGLGTLLWVAFVGGLGSILFPCIYPLIPLTVAFFTKHEGNRASAVRRAVLFCGGILITFTLLGVILGPALQMLATSLWLNVFLFLLMVVLALSLFGMFDIRLPSSWTDRMQSLGSGASIFSPVFMGVAFSLASFTCVVGVIGPILAGSSEHWARATMGMFVYSVGFAIPFFVLALFPMLISAMPKGGSWMNLIKVLLGFFEVCFAGYYLWRMDLSLGWGIGTWPIILSLWVVTIFVGGLYLLGKVRLPHDPPMETLSVPRLLGAIVFFSLALFLFAGLLGEARLPSWIQGLLPPRPAALLAATAAPETETGEGEFHVGFGGVPWTTDYEYGLSTGRREGKRILLNFTGIYCTNCRDMETGLLSQPEIRRELAELVCVELWTDLPSDEVGRQFRTHTTKAMSDRYRKLRSARQSEGYGTTANPWFVVLSPEGKVLAGIGYTRDAEEFLQFLQTGK